MTPLRRVELPLLHPKSFQQLQSTPFQQRVSCAASNAVLVDLVRYLTRTQPLTTGSGTTVNKASSPARSDRAKPCPDASADAATGRHAAGLI